ncbi:MAG: hydantoinase/oxoprolinase family protein [Peptococcaceae bacterium]|jgi:N-methylhydantoinase A/oxoprolinase/acetone carboxylase beta subunit|nr:hydantoinase/oxoprolinase family protein [Peptococcaceae bacterium]
MFIGIDVGGTCTDAVLLDDHGVRATAKATTRPDLLDSLTEALDRVTAGVSADQIERVNLSTTLITNLVAEKKYDRVGLVLIPGPGLNPEALAFPSPHWFIPGAIDYRGRETAPLDTAALSAAAAELRDGGITRVAVAGKFSNRNNSHELRARDLILKVAGGARVELGHQVAGALNFPRRAVTTYLTAATRERYQYFAEAVLQALAGRGITCPVFVLKADGGTCPMAYSVHKPVETLFSGPAASTLGVQALTPPGETVVVVDIGGTTTDLALILGGQPLLSSRGARVDRQLTQVRALAVHSVPVGGDSAVNRTGREIAISSERAGAPFCLGGPLPTPTDALRVLGLTVQGDEARAFDAMEGVGGPLGLTAVEAARRVQALFVEVVAREITLMFEEWRKEPAYSVWQIVQKHQGRHLGLQTVVGVGGGAAGFTSQIASAVGCYPVVPPYAPVANAIGAAVARPTMEVSVRADTEAGYYLVLEEGVRERFPAQATEADLMALARGWLAERSARYGLPAASEVVVTRREVFNMIRDWRTTGRLYDLTLSTTGGIVAYIGAGGDFNA